MRIEIVTEDDRNVCIAEHADGGGGGGGGWAEGGWGGSAYLEGSRPPLNTLWRVAFAN